DNVLSSCYIAGLTASSEVNQSNTYTTYDGAVDVDFYYSNAQIEDSLRNGHIVFTKYDDKVIIEKDINTFTSFSALKNHSFSKNRVLRVLDNISMYIEKIFLNGYIGKVSNNDVGRLLLKGDIVKYLNSLQDIGAITDFTGTTDVEINIGNDLDSVVCNLSIKPVDSMEKIYLTINID
ncbi:MAG: phage tail sheath C-terminal domain-containing protein, partial [Oscillospiraceae bacterium]